MGYPVKNVSFCKDSHKKGLKIPDTSVSFFHGVNGMESTGNGQWAFTFHVFKQS